VVGDVGKGVAHQLALRGGGEVRDLQRGQHPFRRGEPAEVIAQAAAATWAVRDVIWCHSVDCYTLRLELAVGLVEETRTQQPEEV